MHRNHAKSKSRGVPRRTFVKQLAAVTGVTAVAPTIWIPRRSLAKPYDGVELNMLTWPGWGDPHVTTAFEQRTGAKVVVKEYIGGESMLAILEQSPEGTYDLILSDHEYLEQLRLGDQIVTLDPAAFPFDRYWPEFQRFGPHWDNDEMHAVLTSFGYIGIAYNSDQLTEADVQSYDILWDKKVSAKLGWFDWYLPNMGCLSLYNGNRPPYDIDDTALGKIGDTLVSLRSQTSGFLSMGDLFSSFTNGQMWVSPGIGDWVAQLLQKDGHPIAATVPQEGGLMWSDSWAIAKTANNPELAQEWIQYLTSAEGQVKASTLPAFARNIPSKEGWELLNQEQPEWAIKLRHRFDEPNVIDEYKTGNIFPRDLPVQQTIEAWNEIWTEFKSS